MRLGVALQQGILRTHQNQLIVTLFSGLFAKQNLRIIALVHSPFRKNNLTYYNNYYLLNCLLLLLFSLTTSNACLFRLQNQTLSIEDICTQQQMEDVAQDRRARGTSGFIQQRKDKHYNSVHLIDFFFLNHLPMSSD